jgi:drug/metabolite transporter (DMT)-like permease
VVAVLIGCFLGGEAVGLRTILGTLFVLISVLLITAMPVRERVAKLIEPEEV